MESAKWPRSCTRRSTDIHETPVDSDITIGAGDTFIQFIHENPRICYHQSATRGHAKEISDQESPYDKYVTFSELRNPRKLPTLSLMTAYAQPLGPSFQAFNYEEVNENERKTSPGNGENVGFVHKTNFFLGPVS